jgi:CsoR family transcriptional regulator, copper-sensing transcriptional repressor
MAFEFKGATTKLSKPDSYLRLSSPLRVGSSGHDKREDVRLRVKKIHGHVQSIGRMLDEGRSYPQVVQHVIAVRAAMNGVIQVIIDDLVADCMTKTAKDRSFQDSLLELQAVVAKVRG